MRWERQPRWVHRVVGGDAMLASVDGERRTLQGLAAAVWVVLDEPGTDEQILDRLNELNADTPVDPELVTDAIDMLSSHGVIEPLDGPLPTLGSVSLIADDDADCSSTGEQWDAG